MRRSRPQGLAAVSVAFGALVGLSGCTHYHYYTAPPMVGGTVVSGAPTVVSSRPVILDEPALTTLDPPVRAPAVIRSGDVCEVPGTVSGPVYVSGVPGRSSQIVVSQPQGTRVYSSGSGGRGYAWRRPEPESLATTRIEGGISESAPVR
jgi:hypothetical protein